MKLWKQHEYTLRDIKKLMGEKHAAHLREGDYVAMRDETVPGAEHGEPGAARSGGRVRQVRQPTGCCSDYDC